MWTYEQKFNTLNDGALNGQDSWNGATGIIVQTDTKFEGEKAVKVPIAAGNIYRMVGNAIAGSMYVAGRTEGNLGGTLMLKDSERDAVIYIIFGQATSPSNIGTQNNGNWYATDYTFVANRWYIFQIEWDDVAHPNEQRFRIFDTVTEFWSNWYGWWTMGGDNRGDFNGVDKIEISSGSTSISYWDTITPNNPIPGYFLRPTGPGSSCEIVNESGCPDCPDHWQCVDEEVPDYGTSWVFQSVWAQGLKLDLYELSDPPPTQGFIDKIVAKAVSWGPGGGGAGINVAIKTNGVVYMGDDVSYPNRKAGGGISTKEWVNNPFTGQHWTWAEISALEAGADCTGGPGNEGGLTQVFVRVDYTPPSAPNAPINLKTEGLVNPSNVTDTKPEFTAEFDHSNTQEKANSYRIQVIEDGGDWNLPLWDSSKVSFTPINEGQTMTVEYGGAPLPLDRKKYYFRWKFWTTYDLEGPYSDGSDNFRVFVSLISAPVAPGQDARAEQYNNLRGDLLVPHHHIGVGTPIDERFDIDFDTTEGHNHDGVNSREVYITTEAITPVVSDNIRNSNDPNKSTNTTASFVKLKECRLNADLPACRIKFDYKMTGGGQAIKAQIFKNGIAIGTVRQTTSPTYLTASEDFIGFISGDLIQIYGQSTNINAYSNVANFKFCYDNRRITKIGTYPIISTLLTIVAGTEISITNQDP